MVALVSVGCDSARKHEPVVVTFDGGLRRRVIDPPARGMVAAPPHEIHTSGMGPYHLGTPLNAILGMLAQEPRVVLLQLEGVVDYSLVRADSVILGAQRPMGVSFVAVADGKTAHTESGVGVGSTVDALSKALGKPEHRAGRVRDPRLMSFGKLPNVDFILDQERMRVTAVMVTAGAVSRSGRTTRAYERAQAKAQVKAAENKAKAKAKQLSKRARRCRSLTPHRDALWRASKLETPLPRVAFGCFTGSSPEAIVYDEQRRVVLVTGAPGKFRRAAVRRVRGLVFAGAIDIDEDSRDELLVVSQDVTSQFVQVRVELFRIEGTRFVSAASAQVYRVSATKAAWIGAQLANMEFLLSVKAVDARLEVGGVFLESSDTAAMVIAPLAPIGVSIARRRTPPVEGSIRDAGMRRAVVRPDTPRAGDTKRHGATGRR